MIDKLCIVYMCTDDVDACAERGGWQIVTNAVLLLARGKDALWERAVILGAYLGKGDVNIGDVVPFMSYRLT